MMDSLLAAVLVAQGVPGAADTPAAAASDAAQSPAASPPPVVGETPYQRMVRAAAEVTRRPSDGTPDQIRQQAVSDRNHERYFNRAGSSPGQYATEWEECRQIALRLGTSRSTNSWAFAGGVHGGLIGGLIAGAIDNAVSTSRARRDLRRECLIARGWRMVEPSEDGRRRIARLRRPEREAYLDQMIGAAEAEPGARVTDLANLTPTSSYFAAPADKDEATEPRPLTEAEAAEAARQRAAAEETCRLDAVSRAPGSRNQQRYLTRRCIERLER